MNNLKNFGYWLKLNHDHLTIYITLVITTVAAVLAIGYTVWLSNHYPEMQAQRKANYIELCTHADMTVGMCELRFKELQMEAQRRVYYH